MIIIDMHRKCFTVHADFVNPLAMSISIFRCRNNCQDVIIPILKRGHVIAGSFNGEILPFLLKKQLPPIEKDY
jgi:hypothetical protein